MTEEELLRAASRLGEQAVQQLDEAKLAKAVLTRLATEPAAEPRPLYRRVLVLGLAAAAAVMLIVRLSVTNPPSSDQTTALTAPPTTVLHELDDLTTTELEAVLETLAPATAVTPHPESPWLEGLDAKALQQLLRSLEG